MSNLSLSPNTNSVNRTHAYYEALEANRTPEAVELETVTHYVTLWFMAHPDCSDEIDQYQKSQDAMRKLAGETDCEHDDTETYLLLTDAKQWYVSLYAHRWEERR